MMGGTHISFLLLFYYKFHVGDAKREKEEVIRLIAIEISPYTHVDYKEKEKGSCLLFFKGLLLLSAIIYSVDLYLGYYVC